MKHDHIKADNSEFEIILKFQFLVPYLFLLIVDQHDYIFEVLNFTRFSALQNMIIYRSLACLLVFSPVTDTGVCEDAGVKFTAIRKAMNGIP